MTKEKSIIILIGIFNLFLLVGGFWLVGDPILQRNIRYDEQKLQDFSRIYTEANNYYRDKKELPKNLTELNNLQGQIEDKQTKKPYDYKIKSALNYELCTDFINDYDTFVKYSDFQAKYMFDYNSKIDFKKGYNCIEFKIADYVLNDKNLGINLANPIPTATPTPVPVIDQPVKKIFTELEPVSTRVIPRSSEYTLQSVTLSDSNLQFTTVNSTGCPKTDQKYTLFVSTLKRNKQTLRLGLVFDDGKNACEAAESHLFNLDLNKLSDQLNGVTTLEVLDSKSKIINLSIKPKVETQKIPSAKSITGQNQYIEEYKKAQSKIIERNRYCINHPYDPTCGY